MGRLLGVLALVGCSEQDPIGWPEAPDDMTAFLVDHPAVAFPERTRLAGEGRASVSADGPWMEGTRQRWWGRRELVVADVGERIAVITRAGAVQLVVWLDRSGLDPVPVTHAWDVGHNVRIPAGTSLEEVDARDGEVRVRAENRFLEVSTWMPEHAVDHWWYADAIDDGWDPEGQERVRVPAGVELFDAPAGEPILRTAELGSYATVADRDGGYARVQGTAGGWPFDAWVGADDLEPARLAGIGTSGGWACGGAYGHGGTVNVPANTPLHLYAHGPVVGRTLEATWLWVDPDTGDVELSTDFGTAELWVDPTGLL